VRAGSPGAQGPVRTGEGAQDRAREGIPRSAREAQGPIRAGEGAQGQAREEVPQARVRLHADPKPT
jgi:hypothetical protein